MQTVAWRCDGVQWIPTSTRRAVATKDTTKPATTEPTTSKPTTETKTATAAVSRTEHTPRSIDEMRSRNAASARGARLRRKTRLTELQDEVARLRAHAAELEALERAQSYIALMRELNAVLTPEQMRTLSEWCA